MRNLILEVMNSPIWEVRFTFQKGSHKVFSIKIIVPNPTVWTKYISIKNSNSERYVTVTIKVTFFNGSERHRSCYKYEKMTIFHTLVTYNFNFLKLEKHPPVFHARFLTAEYRRFLPAKTLGMCYLYLTLKISMHGFDLTWLPLDDQNLK